MAVVKADGYGHGAEEVSKAALNCGADCLGVAIVEEGARLRKAGIEAPIYLLGEIPGESIRDLINNGAHSGGNIAGLLSNSLESSSSTLLTGNVMTIPEPSILAIVIASMLGITRRQRKA